MLCALARTPCRSTVAWSVGGRAWDSHATHRPACPHSKPRTRARHSGAAGLRPLTSSRLSLRQTIYSAGHRTRAWRSLRLTMSHAASWTSAQLPQVHMPLVYLYSCPCGGCSLSCGHGTPSTRPSARDLPASVLLTTIASHAPCLVNCSCPPPPHAPQPPPPPTHTHTSASPRPQLHPHCHLQPHPPRTCTPHLPRTPPLHHPHLHPPSPSPPLPLTPPLTLSPSSLPPSPSAGILSLFNCSPPQTAPSFMQPWAVVTILKARRAALSAPRLQGWCHATR